MKKALLIGSLVSVLFALSGTPASAVVGDVNEPDVCFVCHSDIQTEQESSHVHTAFAEGDCSNCHNPHASRHAALLMDSEGELCLSCHDGIAEKAAGPNAHGPVARGECSSCHDPHASAHADQLLAGVVDQCSGCHTSVPAWLDRAVVHEPVSAGGCGTCHDPHGSGHDALLAGEIKEACLGCHEPDAAMTAAHGSPAIADSDCTACHDPHSSDGPGLLRTNEHGPFESGNCATCHGSMDGRTDFSVAEIRPLCERCHAASKRYASFTFTHNLDEPGSCVQCHNPHASNVNALLLGPSADVCSSCHFNEPDREKAPAEYVTHDSMDCAQCHLPHGSENEHYLITLETSLCGDCHEDAHRVSHPVGPDVIDARTEEPVTCLSCHQLHGANFEQYLPLDPTRELCLQCHRR
jgi:predicted CXXCH cytochrome family protein